MYLPVQCGVTPNLNYRLYNFNLYLLKTILELGKQEHKRTQYNNCCLYWSTKKALNGSFKKTEEIITFLIISQTSDPNYSFLVFSEKW